MAANSNRQMSFGFSSIHHAKNQKLTRRRKSILALSAAVSAVGIFGFAAQTSRADVYASVYGNPNYGFDYALDGGSFSWLDLTSPSLDTNPQANPGAQDIAQFDSVNASLFGGNNIGVALPTFSFFSSNSVTWGGLNIDSPGTAQFTTSANATAAATVLISGTTSLILSNTAVGGTPSNGLLGPASMTGGINVQGSNGLILSLPVTTGQAQTWSVGIITNTPPSVTATNAAGVTTTTTTTAAIGTPLTVNGTLTLNGALTYTGANDGTSGNATLNGIVQDGTTPGSIVMNSATGQYLSSQVTLNGIVTNTYSVSAGTLTLNGANTFTGGMTLVSGQITVGSLANTGGTAGFGGTTGGPIDFKGGFLGVGGTTYSNFLANSINGTPVGAATFTNVPLNLNIGSAGNTFVVSENLQGTSSIQKIGPGVLSLTGTANNYTGGTTLTAGTLIVPGFSTLGSNQSVTNLGGSTGTLQLNLTAPLSYGNNTTPASNAGTGNLFAGGATLTINGRITNNGLGVANNGSLVLDYTSSTFSYLTAPISVTPNGTNVPTFAGPSLTLDGGTLTILPNSVAASTPATNFASTTISGGAETVFNDPGGAPVNLGYWNYTTTGTVTPNITSGNTVTTIVSNTTITRPPNGDGAVVMFSGPVSGTVTPFQLMDNNSTTMPLLFSSAAGNATGNTPGPAANGVIGSIVQTPTNSSGTITITGTYDTTYYVGYATYGLSDWAVVTPSLGGISYIAPSSSVAGFFSQTNTGINSNPTALQTFNSEGTNAPANYDIEGPGEPRFAGNHAAVTIRWNAPNAGQINVNGNNMDQFVINPLMEGGNMLVTPNVLGNDILISDNAQGTLSSITTQTINAGRSGGQDLVIWQNDINNQLIFTTGITGGGNGGTAGLTEAGPGGVTNDASNSYTQATTIDGGTIQVAFSPGLGTSGAANTLNLNAGTLITTSSFSLDNNTGTGATADRNVILGAAGGTIAAKAGTVLTVDGNISGPGNLSLGTGSFTWDEANSHNSTIQLIGSAGVGLVILSGHNTYTGSTIVNNGTLQADGSYTTANFIVNPNAQLNGVPTFPANSTITVQPGGYLAAGDNGVGGMTVGTLNLNTSPSTNTGSTLSFAFNLATASINPIAADPIQVNTSLVNQGTTSTPVALSLFQQFTTSQFQTSGTYVLMQVPAASLGGNLTTTPQLLAVPNGTTGETTSVVDGFLLTNPQVLTTYALSETSIGGGIDDIELEVSSAVFGATWNKTSGGTWDATSDWLANAAAGATGTPPIPNGEVDTATFGATILAPSTITVDASPNSTSSTLVPVTVGNLAFNSAVAYTLAAGTSPNITLNNGLSSGTITDSLGQHTIAIPLALTNGVLVTVTNPTDTMTLKGQISGSGGVNFVFGNGTLVLSGNQSNTYTGATTITSSFGTLQLGDGSTYGTLGNTQPFTNNGILAFDQPSGTTQTFANAITGTGGLVQIGSAGKGSEIILTGANAYTGATVINPNTALQLGAAVANGLNGTVALGGLLDINGQNGSVGSLQDIPNATTFGTVDNVAAGGSVTLTVGLANTSTTFSGTIQNTSGTVSLSKQGTGVLTLEGTSTYSGTTTIAQNGGYLQLTASNNILPTAPIIIVNSVNGALILDNGVTIGNPVEAAGVSAEEFLQVLPNASAEITGPVNAGAGSDQFRLGFPNSTGTLTLTNNVIVGGPTGTNANQINFFTEGNLVFAGTAHFMLNSSTNAMGFGRSNVGLNLLVENQASLTNTGTAGADFGETTNDPYVNVTVQDQGSINLGSGIIAMDTQTVANTFDTLTLNGGTVTTGGITWTPLPAAAGTSSAIINFNGGVLIAGANNTQFLPFGNDSNTLYNNVGNGGALFDTNGFNIESTTPTSFLSVGNGVSVTNFTGQSITVTDGGLTKLGAGELVFGQGFGTNLTDNQNNVFSYTGPTNVYGGLLEFSSDVQSENSAWIQTYPGGAVGTQEGSAGDSTFLASLASAPLPQTGSLALSSTDNSYSVTPGGAGQVINIDFTGSKYSGELPGANTPGNVSGGVYVLNMASVFTDYTDTLTNTLAAMSIGATSGANSGNLTSVVMYDGSITPGPLNGVSGAPTTYQLGGGGSLDLVAVGSGTMFGVNSTGYSTPGTGIPLPDVKGKTNVLIENGGAVILETTNTYSGTTTIDGVMVEDVPGSDLPSGVTSYTLEPTILAVKHLADTASSIGTSAPGVASNLVINGGVLKYSGAGDTSSRLFTIGQFGATLDASETGTIPLIYSNTGSEAFSSGVTGAVSLTLTGTAGSFTANGGTANFVNVLAAQLGNPTGGTLSVVMSGANSTNVWALTNAGNTYSGGTTVNSGILQLGAPGTVLGSTLGSLAVNTAGTLDLNGNSVSAGALSGSGVIDDIVAGSSPTLTIGNGNASGTFGGVIQNTSGTVSLTTVGTGTLFLTGANTFGGATTITSGSTLQLGTGGATGSVGAGAILDSGSLVIDRTGAIAIPGNITGAGSLTTIGSGTVNLAGTNGYSGGTFINGGTVQLGNVSGAGTGPVAIAAGHTFDLNSFSPTIGGLSGAGIVDNVSAGGTVNLTVNDPSATPTTFTGLIQNTTGTVGLILAAGTLVLTGANTYGGGTTISGGALELGAGGTSGSVTGPILDNSALILNRSDTAGLVFANNVSGSGSVSKVGTSTVTFTGSNTYGGTTTDSAGVLIVASATGLPIGNKVINNSVLSIQAGNVTSPVDPAQITGTGSLTVGVAGTPAFLALGTKTGSQSTSSVNSLTIASGSTLDITNNTLDINYQSSANDPAAQIRADLVSGYNADKWNGTGIISSNAQANTGLYAVGYVDGRTDSSSSAGSDQILIKNTIAGDANLDGLVNFTDLLIVAQDYGRTSQDWGHGDFNYDSLVNFSDLLLLAQNYGKSLSAGQLAQLPGSFSAQWQLAEVEIQAAGISSPSSVPEPATTGLLAIGTAGLLARRRRRSEKKS